MVMIASCADVDKALADGTTPLFVAAQNGHVTTTEKLLIGGAVVDKAPLLPHNSPITAARQNIQWVSAA